MTAHPRMLRSATVITPCLNAAELLSQTIESVFAQTAFRAGRLDLQYIICDGGSTDGSADIARRAAGPNATVISEPDSGMYDALAKGLRRATGDIVSYLNAGDMYYRTALDVVADIFAAGEEKWLTGLAVGYNAKGQFCAASLPYRYRRTLLRRGMYGSVLPYVQQESTFWRRELLRNVDLERLSKLRYAGDAYLWSCFAQEAELAIVESFLGGFLVHTGQKSEAVGAYREEMLSISSRPRAWDQCIAAFDRLIWHAPPRVKKTLNPRLYRCSPRTGLWV